MKNQKLAVIVILICISILSPSLGMSDLNREQDSYLDNITPLSVTIGQLPSEINDGTTVNISVTILTDDTNGTLIDVAIEVSAGLFENNESMISFQLNAANTTLYVVWTAPILTETAIDVTINAIANLGDLEATDSKIVHVNVLFFDFAVEWTVENQYFQNKTGFIGLIVTDQVTSLPVTDAEVTFSLEAGHFVQTGADTITVTTDANGSAQAIVDFQSQEFVFDQNEVLVSAIVSKAKYNELLTNTTIKVIKSSSIPSVSVTFHSFEKEGKLTTLFTLNASLSGRPWINATFRITATGGMFENGESSTIAKTNASGLATVQWIATGIPDVKDDVVVYFTVELLTVDYGLIFEPETYNLTILGSISSASLPTQTSNVGISILPLIFAFPILRRRKK